jgi:predicted TIM-barrel fold metal-dependent hydrolase
MKIIDAHMHLGECRVFDINLTEEDLLRGLDENGIETAIVQPFPGCKDFRATHDRIATLVAKHPGRIYGLCSLSPHRNRDEYHSEVERCVKQLGFVGVKLHTIGHAVLPLTEDGMLVFEVGADLKIPVMVHTGMGLPFAQPSLCLPAARKFPETKVILAHAGFTFLSAEAQVITSECPNIYLETPWCASHDIGWMIRTLGPERVMLGSDLPTNISSELAKYRGLGLEESRLQQVFSVTAQTVFGLS